MFAGILGAPQRLDPPDGEDRAERLSLRSGKPFLCEGRRHRLDPFGDGHERNYDGFKPFAIAVPYRPGHAPRGGSGSKGRDVATHGQHFSMRGSLGASHSIGMEHISDYDLERYHFGMVKDEKELEHLEEQHHRMSGVRRARSGSGGLR
jgi:hypothetical protein